MLLYTSRIFDLVQLNFFFPGFFLKNSLQRWIKVYKGTKLLMEKYNRFCPPTALHTRDLVHQDQFQKWEEKFSKKVQINEKLPPERPTHLTCRTSPCIWPFQDYNRRAFGVHDALNLFRLTFHFYSDLHS